MKIFYVAPMRLPTEKAHGIQIMETVAAMATEGADITLFVSRVDSASDHDVFQYYSLDSKFPIRRIFSPNTVSWGKIGYGIHALIFAFGIVYRSCFERPDVIYTRDPICMLVLYFLSGRPVVWEVHGEHTRVPRFVLRRLSGIVAITQGLADTYIKRGAEPQNMLVARDAVALERFTRSIQSAPPKATIRGRYGIDPDAFVALYMGSFNSYTWKGVDIVKAAAALCPEVQWVLVGGNVAECEAVTKGSSPNFLPLPRVGRAEVAHLLTIADVLLLPNKKGDAASERDTSPMKLFEYMTSNIPIAASDLPSLREVLSESDAFFAIPNDPESLRDTVRSIVSRPEEAKIRAAAAREHVATFTWANRAKTILQFLARTI